EGDRPPGPEAREPVRHQRRPRQDPRLRPGQAHAARRPLRAADEPAHRPGNRARCRPRDARLHGARAGEGEVRGRAVRHLLLRRTTVHDTPPSFRQLTFRRGQIFAARFAPDGQTVMYSGAWDGKPMEIFVGRPESPESRSFGLAGAEVLSISKTGDMAVSLDR